MSNRHKRWSGLVVATTILVFSTQGAFAQEVSIGTGDRATNSTLAWILDQIENGREPGRWERNEKGEIVSLNLSPLLANDVGLGLFKQFGSVHTIRLQTSGLSPELTKQGISSLARMTNLTSLSLACGHLLKTGVFDEICKLRGLRELSLYGACPPQKEYASITNLQNLVRLRISLCANFGDREINLLTNLPTLKSLTLEYNGFSRDGTNVLRSLSGLTNFAVRVARPSTQVQ
jgi:hypothetical protein